MEDVSLGPDTIVTLSVFMCWRCLRPVDLFANSYSDAFVRWRARLKAMGAWYQRERVSCDQSASVSPGIWEGASDDEALSDFWPYEGESRGDVPGDASFYLNVKGPSQFPRAEHDGG